MTQEDRQLLFVDLCARLPYGVKCNVYKRMGVLVGLNDYGAEIDYGDGEDTTCEIKFCKPYLRPMSSMTEDEKNELNNVLEYQYYADDSRMCEASDWLNAHHFDYRGLIEKGLAIEVTEENNPYKD